MPIFRSGTGQAPVWCELEFFDIARLEANQSFRYQRKGQKEKLIVGEGECVMCVAGAEKHLKTGDQLDIGSNDSAFEVIRTATPVVLVRMAGRWGDEVGGSGLFGVKENHAFDNHYHDCDEYWIIFAGSGLAVSEGKEYQVGPGDCVATGMGWHHDFPIVHTPVRAVYFETTQEGQKRPGHLWEPEHGPAAPKQERV
jgi:mannose-6-phosphate isomerase-like protein (cupin superfamily)